MSGPSELHVEKLLAESAKLRALARGLLGDPGRADDAVQEAWIAANRRSWPGGAPPRAWLSEVVRRLSHTWRRGERRRRRHETDGAREERLPGPDETLLRVEGQRLLAEAVLRLDEPHRQAIALRYFEGLEPTVIARRLDVPAGTVRSRLKRALDQLRRDLDRRTEGGRELWAMILLPLAGWRPRGLTTLARTTAWGIGGLGMGKALVIIGASTAALAAILALGWARLDPSPRPTPVEGDAAVSLDAADRPAPDGPSVTGENRAPAAPVEESAATPTPGRWWLCGEVHGPRPETEEVVIELRTRRYEAAVADRWSTPAGAPVAHDLVALFESGSARPEILRLWIDHPDFMPVEQEIEVDRDRLRATLLTGARTEFCFEVTLVPARGVVRGRVEPSPGFAPDEIAVGLVPFEDHGFGDDGPAAGPEDVVHCGTTGEFRLRSSRLGPHAVVAYVPRESWGTRGDLPEPWTEHVELDGREELELETFTLDTGAVIEGRAVLHGGQPAAWTRVSVWSGEGDTWLWSEGPAFFHDTASYGISAHEVAVAEDGTFTISGLAAQDFELRLEPYCTTYQLPGELEPPMVPVVAPARGVELRLGFALASFRVGSRGRLLDEARVRVDDRGSVEPGPEGVFTYAVAPGRDYELTFTCDGYVDETITVRAAELSGNDPRWIELEPGPHRPRLVIELLGDPERQLEYAQLELERVGPGDGYRRIDHWTIRTGDTLCFDELRPGRYRGSLRPTARESSQLQRTFFLRTPLELELEEGVETRIEWTLCEGGRLAVPGALLSEEGPSRFALHGPGGPVPLLMATDVLHCGYVLCFRKTQMEAGRDWESDRALPAGAYTLDIEGPSGLVRSFPVVIEVGRTTVLEVL